MLTFEEKLTIIESFPQLERRDVSLGRVNFHYEESAFGKKTVVYHLHPNGNGFVYAGHLAHAHADANDKGMVNISDYSADELRNLIQASLDSLSTEDGKIEAEAARSSDDQRREYWIGPDNHALLLVYEDELWNIYTGSNLEAAFESYTKAEQYLLEEGFHQQTNIK
ncbi:hypothetical protein PP175_24910 [Aneurinibacillus sp. Ricciae_BoGa-3]|uniref:hypothetical protein n=1 Tax=Aneurinibacillus sp. Ricciae_BoGa-3 TaxID=3022697 RepID=UPI002341EDD2|nr:hypothetical protein [Aneurinibacillus sp. Ricciae_BoGa-3]WCK54476.1 hypothetical protein PP175_24910 [Aneurinibacillus sp. Ricciae_BoGa-3]